MNKKDNNLKDGNMDHSKMDHSKMDHSNMDHSKMDHSNMDHSKMDHSKMDHSNMDHSKMDHSKMDHSNMDHSKMDHCKMDHSNMDHSNMDHGKMDHSKMDHSNMDHSKMDHSKMDHSNMDHDRGAMGGHAHHHHGSFKEIFLKSLPLGIAILFITPLMDIQWPFQIIFPYADVVAAVLATILYLYGGKPFYMGAKDEFMSKAPGMMSLITLGITVSYVYSVYAVAARYVTGEHVMDFFFEFSTLILIMLFGHWIEMKALGEAGNAQKALAELLPKDAHVVLTCPPILVPVSELVEI